MSGIDIEYLGGNCPVQAEGSVDGYRFYFRARGDQWSVQIAPTDEELWTDKRWVYVERYGEWPDAGWMDESEAKDFLITAIEKWRNERGPA